MGMTYGAAWIALAALLLAGCSGSSEPAATTTQNPRGTAEVSSTDDATPTGTVRGTVWDDEQRPIDGASVGLIQLGIEVLTSEGAFEFTKVPAGTYDLAAARLGYETAGRRITVVADETTEVTLVLLPFTTTEPLAQSVQRVTLHHVGETYFTWAVNLTGVSPMCDGCVFLLWPPDRPDFVLWEVFGKHTVANPTGDKEHFWVFNACNGCSGYALLGEVEARLPARMELNETAMEKLRKDNKFQMWHQLLCENFWFCVEERRESWVTFFFDYPEIPAEFSAMPKS